MAALASAWRDAALAEHASVAAFARLALELLHHGASLELVAQAQLASLDEIRHAESCKRHGESLTKATWHFGLLPTNDCLEDTSLLGLLGRNIIEGCIGETIAACLARERALRATDPVLRDDLMRIPGVDPCAGPRLRAGPFAATTERRYRRHRRVTTVEVYLAERDSKSISS